MNFSNLSLNMASNEAAKAAREAFQFMAISLDAYDGSVSE